MEGTMRIIYATTDIESIIKTNREPTLDELQRLVGGYIEVVYLRGNRQMIINEEGKCKDLPVNERATMAFLDTYPTSDDYIAGDAVILRGILLS